MGALTWTTSSRWKSGFFIVDTCAKQGWGDPHQLALLGAATFTAAATHHALRVRAHQLWKYSGIVFPDKPDGSTLALKGASANAESLLGKLKSASLCDSLVRKDASLSLRKVRMPEEFSGLFPEDKIDKLTIASVNRFKIRRFPRTDPQMDSMGGIRFFFESFATPIRRFCGVCELMWGPALPVRESTEIERISIFNPCGAFSIYVSYIRKACFP